MKEVSRVEKGFYFVYKYKGDIDEILWAVMNKEKVNIAEFKNIFGVDHIVVDEDAFCMLDEKDDDYYDCFANVNQPPVVFYTKGNETLLDINNKKRVAVFNLNNQEIKEFERQIKDIKKNEITVVVDIKDEKLVDILVKNDVKFIGITTDNITVLKNNNDAEFNKAIEKGNAVIVTEFPKNAVEKTRSMAYQRLLLGFGYRNLLLGKDRTEDFSNIQKYCEVNKISPDYAIDGYFSKKNFKKENVK